MIMRRATKWLGTTAFLATLLLLGSGWVSESNAADARQFASRQIDLGGAQPVRRVKRARRSVVSQAAAGELLTEAPPRSLERSRVRNDIQRVGYYPGEPTCGCGEIVCDCGEVSCGIEPTCGCGMGNACSCGVEAGCGFEVVEPGCGWADPDCCVAPACDADCGCDSCGGNSYSAGCPIFLPYLRVQWNRFAFFAGTQGFKGPPNFPFVNGNNERVGSGSFGYYQGFNEGRSLNRWLNGTDLAAQFGLRATQSSLSGAEFTSDKRYQVFLTGGIFRRVDFGLQFGLVFDYMRDDWYYNVDLTQLRGEVSWNTGRVLTYGFQYMVGVNHNSSPTVVRDISSNAFTSLVDFQANNQYRLFLRRRLAGYGEINGFAGWTDTDDGLLGSSVNVPLCRTVMLNTTGTYLIPKSRSAFGAQRREGWNIGIGFSWRPGGNGSGKYSRPMFDVADNGTFMVTPR